MRTLGHPLIGEYKARLQLSKGIFDLLWFGEDLARQIIPLGSRNASEDAKLFFGQAIQKTVA